MPELPEVETVRIGISPHLTNKHIQSLIVRQRQLRWPIPEGLESQVAGAKIHSVTRRAKYLLINITQGTIIVHLGMSGSLRIVPITSPVYAHDHYDMILPDNQCLRYRDPRRFGALLWHPASPETHPLLSNLGPEPLEPGFNGSVLMTAAKHRRCPIKTLIMDGHVVAGVGNIYACESLFLAKIHPQLPCNQVSLTRYNQLAGSIQQVLTRAIAQGGTTLRDFSQADGKPGYFVNALQVYGREGQPCVQCHTKIQMQRTGQRTSFFCPNCQT